MVNRYPPGATSRQAETNFPEFRRAGELLNVIAYEKRLQILDILVDQEMTVSELAEHVGLQHAALSQHLGKLYQQGLITRRREWKHIIYRCGIPEVKQLIASTIEVSAGLRVATVPRLPPRGKQNSKR